MNVDIKIKHLLGCIKRYIKAPKLLRDVSLNKRIESSIRLYEKCIGKKLDLDNPTSFTEKIRWYELFYYKHDMSRIVDKYLFKHYINEKLGGDYTIELYGMWTSVDDLKADWDKLPNVFVLKSNISDNGRNIKVIHNKKEINFDDLKKELNSWLNPINTLLNSYCNAYYGTIPRIIAERYCENVANQLYDYKAFCFNGKPYCFYVATEHMQHDGNSYPVGFYDLNWKQMDVQYGIHPTAIMKRPVHFDEMKKIAAELSADFPFVRVDFFDTEDRLYMAEMTFYPGGGLTPYYPNSFDKKLGEMFLLPKQVTYYENGKFHLK